MYNNNLNNILQVYLAILLKKLKQMNKEEINNNFKLWNKEQMEVSDQQKFA